MSTMNEAAATLDDLTLATAEERRRSVETKMAEWLESHPGSLDWFNMDSDYVESGEGTRL